MHVCVRTEMHVEAREVHVRRPLQLLSTLCFETGFLAESSTHQLTELAGQLAPGLLQSYSPHARVGFFTGVLGI